MCVCMAVHICMHSGLGGYKWACLMFLCLTVCPTGTPYTRSGGVPLNELAFVLSYSRGTILIISSEKTGSNFAPTVTQFVTRFMFMKKSFLQTWELVFLSFLRSGEGFRIHRRGIHHIGFFVFFILANFRSPLHWAVEQAGLDWPERLDQGSRWSRGVCVWEREKKKRRWVLVWIPSLGCWSII